jgi:hypothetical protein
VAEVQAHSPLVRSSVWGRGDPKRAGKETLKVDGLSLQFIQGITAFREAARRNEARRKRSFLMGEDGEGVAFLLNAKVLLPLILPRYKEKVEDTIAEKQKILRIKIFCSESGTRLIKSIYFNALAGDSGIPIKPARYTISCF